jgi:hypothetical protein
LPGSRGAEAVVQAQDAGRDDGVGAQGGGRVEALADGQGGRDVEEVDRDHRVVGDDADLDPGGGQAELRVPAFGAASRRPSA